MNVEFWTRTIMSLCMRTMVIVTGLAVSIAGVDAATAQTPVAAMAAAAAQGAAAQGAAVVRGTVITQEDGLALPNATVTLPSLGLKTTTDDQGKYTLTVPAGQVKGQLAELRVSFPGVPDKVLHVRLTAGDIEQNVPVGLGFFEEVTVGSRAPGAASEKAVPVDIITREQIAETGLSETNQIIQALAPSFNFPRPTITDGTDTVRPATLRGLGPDQVLVLINGKRRHTSALVHLNNSVGRGSTGVDLNAIPASAIERIEVLRDGAAAQYGSDAIAGVINIVLKSRPAAPQVGFKVGGTTHEDGGLNETSGTYGFGTGRGNVFVSGEYRDRNLTNRAAADPRDQLRPGDAGNNPVPQPNHRWGDGDTNDLLTFVNSDFQLGDSGTTYLYAFGGVSRRLGSSAGFFRRGLDNRNQPSIYPLGFLPLIEPDVLDISATGGVRGVKAGWFYDGSIGYGYNSFDFHVRDSLNASLGPNLPPNQTEFYSGSLLLGMLIGNVDFSREMDLGLERPVNVAFGAEVRRESYEILAGEPASYADGGFPDQFGGRAALGAQVFPGFRPANEVQESRTNVAGYIDVEGEVASRLRLGLAGRVEHYSDFGGTADGKVTARFEILPSLVLRGGFSTGFRAPSLAQSFFSSTATNFLNVNGQLQPFESLTLPVNSPAARALGAIDLKPEQSLHFSGGVVWNPLPSLDITIDAYRIDIDDRIVLSGNFNQPPIAELLRPFGANSARFFTNAIDTETRGVEVTANYGFSLDTKGSVLLSAAFSAMDTNIVGAIATPPPLQAFSATLFDRIERRRIECGQPNNNWRLGGSWSLKGLHAAARVKRYGEYCSFTDQLALDQEFSPEWLTDLDVSYTFSHYTIGAGIQNLFDVFPDENIPANSFNGIQVYPSHSPFGMNGRFAYARIGYKF